MTIGDSGSAMGPVGGAIVVVEGRSDAAAVAAYAVRLALDSDGFEIRVSGGVTNFPQLLARLGPAAHGSVMGMYDLAGEHFVRRAVSELGVDLGPDDALEAHGFFVCVTDLEDELIRAVGPEGVEAVLDAEGELRSFRRFQAMPHHRGLAVDRQLHRFMGTRATRKVRMATRLVEALGVDEAPSPLRLLGERLLVHR